MTLASCGGLVAMEMREREKRARDSSSAVMMAGGLMIAKASNQMLINEQEKAQ